MDTLTLTLARCRFMWRIITKLTPLMRSMCSSIVQTGIVFSARPKQSICTSRLRTRLSPNEFHVVGLSMGAGTGGAGWASAHPGKKSGSAWPTLEILPAV